MCQVKSFVLKIILDLFVLLNTCVCSTCMPGALDNPKRASDHLELELRVDVNHHMGAGNGTWILRKNNKCS